MMEKISTFLQNKNSKFLQVLGVLAVLILIATPVIATAPAPAPAPINPLAILNTIIGFLQSILILLAVIYILFGAFNFVTAGGDDKKIESGRKAIFYALIAIAIAALAHGLVLYVRQLMGEIPRM